MTLAYAYRTRNKEQGTRNQELKTRNNLIMRKTITLLLILIIGTTAHAQNLSGTITDTQGNPIAFANIYVSALKTGTTTNVEGEYQLPLPRGEWNVLFQYLGYTSQSHKVTINGETDNKEMDVCLQSRHYQIKEIKVLASGEDPAYYVMRKAIAMGSYYQNQVSEYSCKVYLKGSGKLTKIPALLKRKLAKEGIKKGKTFVTENISKIHFQLPDKLKQEVLSMRSSGDDNNTSPNSLITANLYNTRDNGFISPLDKTALSVYSFKLESVFEDQGRIINRIKVIPKRKGKDLFKGILNIAENYWNIHSADLTLKMPMTDVRMRQIYAPIENNVWMPVSFDFDIAFKGFGLGMKYLYVAAIKEYQITLNPALDHTIITKTQQYEQKQQEVMDSITASVTNKRETLSSSERKRQETIKKLIDKQDLTNGQMHKLDRLMRRSAKKTAPPTPLEIEVRHVKISKDARDKDSTFWNQFRSIPLTQDENKSFKEKKSNVKRNDSLKQVRKKFKIHHLITGHYYRLKDGKERVSITTPSFIDPTSLSFNTVDGFNYRFNAHFRWRDSLGREIFIKPQAKYAFARKHLDGSLFCSYHYSGKKRARITLEGGTTSQDFNGSTGISPFLNSITTLLLKENHLKLYQKEFVKLTHKTDIINGMELRTGLEWANRRQLINNSSFNISNPKDREYSSNIPRGSSPDMVQNHKALVFSATLEYTPRYHYSMYPSGKVMRYSNYPTFALHYRKGMKNTLGSDTSYDFVEASIRQNTELGFNDILSYKIKAGTFMNRPPSYFADYHHFSTNKPYLMMRATMDTYRLIPYYEMSASQRFLEGHLQLSSDRLLLKRFPILNNSLALQEKIFTSYLCQPGFKNYWEIGYGLSQIFLIMDLEVVSGFKGSKHQQTALKIKINL